MKFVSIFLIFLVVRFSESVNAEENSYSEVETCSDDRCQLPYCFCSNQTIPGDFSARETPQFVRRKIAFSVVSRRKLDVSSPIRDFDQHQRAARRTTSQIHKENFFHRKIYKSRR